MQINDRFIIGQKISLITIWANVILLVIKLVAGLLAHSTAMLSDSLHTLSDLVTTVGVFVSFKISRKPPDTKHPYGHGRAESVCAKVIALSLVAVGGSMAVKALGDLRSGNFTVPGKLAAVAAVISIAVQELLFQISYRTGTKINSKALQADAWHHRSDALSSVAALAGITLARAGYAWFDPLAGIAVSLTVAVVGLTLLRDTINEFMDCQCEPQYNEKMKKLALTVKGVEYVSKFAVRRYGPNRIIDIAIAVNPEISVSEGHTIAEQVKNTLKNNDSSLSDVLVHVDPIKRNTT